jgi:hypothetical protein
MRSIDCNSRIKQVKGRYQAALQTVRVLIGLVSEQPELLFSRNLDLGVIRSLEQELHDIYFVRMFASFESSLRHYWRTDVRNTKPFTMVLIASIAGRRGVPDDTRDAVQEIREFRNHLIHAEHEANKRFTIEDASRHLNTYLARLPLQW